MSAKIPSLSNASVTTLPFANSMLEANNPLRLPESLRETAKQGKGRRELPWIWKMQFETTKPNRDKVSDTVEQWTREAMRIEWLPAHASVARFEEEMKLLEAESERVGKMFRFHQKKMVGEGAAADARRGKGGGRGTE
ncbi:hypothetical protein M422DRAFT_269989 [Sphaerobolus stellatus SS14]|uniref:Uncharacterized protein n=1 Tax=Sphaerobolus stellatus (strain SS14) TaxID=990650 RepID=A0A0C9U3A3_SPHS4|nr:hypothetical protein M422DRAFT_269989 [Sphaerobolus stellatus SS14]